MHVSHMKSFVPEQTLQHLTKPSPQQAQAYNTQRVQAVEGRDGQNQRGARQPAPQRSDGKLTTFDTGATALKSFSSQLAALDLSALGDAGTAADDANSASGAASEAEEPGIFQLLAKATGPSA